MNKKSWLIAGLSLAMAASIGVGISACGGETHTHNYDAWDYNETQHWKYCDEHGTDKSNIDETTKANHDFKDGKCECGAKKPEHTHNYDAWDYNETQHWKYCDEHGSDKSNIDESTREPHHFVEGICDKCEAKEPAMYVYGVGPNFHSKGTWPGLEQVRNTKDEWVKMELGDDGVYTADIYLTPDDKFAVGNVKTLKSYPDVSAISDALQVETANTYTVTFNPADKTVTFAVHAHTYDVWQYDADQHWKVCSTKDQTVDESSRAPHVYDQPDNKCVCGAVETVSCEHSNGYVFDYDELPAAEADGGTLQKTCPDCKDKQTVTYSKGFTGDGTIMNIPSTIGDISEEGTYYFTTGNKYQTLGLKITEAGTYTLTFEEVYNLEKNQGERLGLMALMFGKAYASIFSVPTSCVFSGIVSAVKKQDLTDYAVKVNEKNVAADTDLAGDLVTLSFTVTEEQVQAGDLYVSIQLTGLANRGSVAYSDSLSHLVTVTKSAATAASVQEVAMLPEKKD